MAIVLLLSGFAVSMILALWLRGQRRFSRLATTGPAGTAEALKKK